MFPDVGYYSHQLTDSVAVSGLGLTRPGQANTIGELTKAETDRGPDEYGSGCGFPVSYEANADLLQPCGDAVKGEELEDGNMRDSLLLISRGI